MNVLVRFALAGRPLPGAALALEMPDIGTTVVTGGLSPILVGWSVSDHAIEYSRNVAMAISTEREAEGEVTAPRDARTTTAPSNGDDVVSSAEASMRNEAMVNVDEGLLENVDFDERLSQQI